MRHIVCSGFGAHDSIRALVRHSCKVREEVFNQILLEDKISNINMTTCTMASHDINYMAEGSWYRDAIMFTKFKRCFGGRVQDDMDGKKSQCISKCNVCLKSF